MTEVERAIARLDAASLEMLSAIDEINRLWNRTGKGEPALTLLEIKACRAAGRRARRSAGL